jgi:hypothetical protein
MLEPKFPLGRVLLTQGVEDRRNMGLLIDLLIERHQAGDWGDLCNADKRCNDDAVKYGTRILSAYDTVCGKIWIITEWDRSSTTLLLPEEY